MGDAARHGVALVTALAYTIVVPLLVRAIAQPAARPNPATKPLHPLRHRRRGVGFPLATHDVLGRCLLA